MKKYSIFTILILSILWSCNNATDKESTDNKENKDAVFNDVYNDYNIESQTFTIDNSIDNIIEGDNGTKIRITKNTFVDQDGNLIEGQIEIELKEALTPIDMVMGNLTTTFNDQPLQSGGMIYLNATFDSNQLKIAENKTILTSVPSDTLLTDMSIFKGNRDSLNGMNWSDPEPIGLPQAESDSIPVQDMDAFEKSHNIKYSVDGFMESLDQPQSVRDEVSRIAWEGAGLKITKDSTFKIGEYTVNFYKQNELTKWSQVFKIEKGTNSYVTDQNVYYIFKLKNLGWANIDRLYSDPRTEEVDLLASVSNESDFNFVYTTMVTQSMYLPGYQKKDESFSFTHGDYESTQLPIGEKATIIATACKDGKTYFGYQTIEIKKKQDVKIELKESSKNKIKKILENEI